MLCRFLHKLHPLLYLFFTLLQLLFNLPQSAFRLIQYRIFFFAFFHKLSFPFAMRILISQCLALQLEHCLPVISIFTTFLFKLGLQPNDFLVALGKFGLQSTDFLVVLGKLLLGFLIAFLMPF